MAAAAARELFGPGPSTIVDIRLEKGLILQDDRPNTLYLAVSEDRNSYTVSSAADEEFVTHSRGRFGAAPEIPPLFDLHAARRRCLAECTGEEVYRRLSQQGYDYGPTFRGVRRAWFGASEALFQVAWPDGLDEEAGFAFHPAVLDAYMNAAPLLLDGAQLWLPAGADRLVFFEALPKKGWGHARLARQSAHEVSLDLAWTNELGRCSCSCRLVYRAVRRAGEQPGKANLLTQHVWERQALETRPQAQAGKRWLVLADQGGLAEGLARELTAAGGEPVLVYRGKPPEESAAVRYCLQDDSPEEMVRVLEGLGEFTTAVHLWSADPPPEDPLEAQTPGAFSVLLLSQTVLARQQSPQLCLVTRGACRVAAAETPVVPMSTIWGLGRTIANEQPGLRPRLIDLGSADADASVLYGEIAANDRESEVALRGGQRWVCRLRPMPLTRPAGTTPFRLAIRIPGSISNLLFEAVHTPSPAADEVVVAVVAAGVNFKDVVKIMGLIDADSLAKTRSGQALGGECAGRVVAVGAGVSAFRPGDEVVALTGNCFGALAVAKECLTALKPAGLSFEEAATLPVAYLTAYYALCECARVRPGERVLLHAATGGVGQAALRISQALGLEVLATAGSDAKRDLLRRQGVRCVMDSRSLAFAEEARQAAGGIGVDVVLNTLPARTLPASLEALRPRGRLVDLSNIYTASTIDLRAFQKGLSVTAFDLDQLMRTDLDEVGKHFRAAMRFVVEKQLPALPHRSFPLSEAAEAFRLMAQAQHIGKLVLVPDANPDTPVDVSELPGPRLDGNATYLVTGGTSGFGLFTAGWLVERGARHLALLSRRGFTSAEDEETAAALRRRGATVRVLLADLSSADELSGAFAEMRRTMPPLRGVIHSATLYLDGVLTNLDVASFRRMLLPKAVGAWHLHRLTAELPLDFFVLYSSVAGLYGNTGQASYAAANAFLDGLAEHRRALGLPATAVAWGPIGEVGAVKRHQWLENHFRDVGLDLLPPADALRWLGVLLERGCATGAVQLVRWEKMRLPGAQTPRFSHFVQPAGNIAQKRTLAEQLAGADAETLPALAVEQLTRMAAAVLGGRTENFDSAAPLTSLGLDSLLASELSNRLRNELGVTASAVRLLGGSSIHHLAQQVVSQLLAPAVRSAAPPPRPSKNGSPEAWPLSWQQQPIWGLDRRCPGRGFFNLPAVLRLKGPLDADALRRALQGLLTRHAPLAAPVRVTADGPIQTVRPRVVLDLPVEDLSTLPASESEAVLAERARRMAQSGFDLTAEPLLRARLLRLAGNVHALILVVHHLAADGASLPPLLREGFALYLAERAGVGNPLPPLSWTYRDFVLWQRERMTGSQLHGLLDHWRKTLDGRLPALPLPLDCVRSETPSLRGAQCPFEVPAEVVTALRALARAEHCTLFMTLLTGLGVHVHRVTAMEDFCLGTFTANRGRPEAQHLVGCFINQLALRIDLRGDPSLRTALRRIQTTTLAAQEYGELPFALLTEHLEAELPPPHSPLQVVLIFHNELGSLDQFDLPVDGLEVEFRACDNGGAKRDWTFHVFEEDDRLVGNLEYDVDLFKAETARETADGFLQALALLATEPDRALSAADRSLTTA
jgi:NADPH:quinone reductase-like Zn-dependent oxidoreductase